MTWWTPIPLRWAEESEAREVCALAALHREPYSGAVRLVEWVAPIGAPGAWSVRALAAGGRLVRLLELQIK
jgi:hypothetical protein